MSFSALIAAAILSLSPGVGEARADRLGAAIHDAVGPDLDAAALLVVIGHEESRWSADVCACRVVGLGEALGCYQMDPALWGRNCGPVEEQTVRAFEALRISGWPERGLGALQRYAGARSPEHPEVRERRGLYWITRERLALAACI